MYIARNHTIYCNEFLGSEPKEVFCMELDSIFDILNCVRRYDPCDTRNPITLSNLPHLLQEIGGHIAYIKILDILVDTSILVRDATKIPVNQKEVEVVLNCKGVAKYKKNVF